MANQVTIYNLEQENNVLENDFVPVSDGNSTRKLNLLSNYATTNLSNLTEIDEDGARLLVDSFFNYVNIEEEDSGFILDRTDAYVLKTALYSINKKLPGNIVLTDETSIDYSRDIKLDDTDIPVTFLGKELTISDSYFTSIDDLCNVTNINVFDQYSTPEGVKVNDYVKVDPDSTKNNNVSYYLLTHFDSETGAIDPLVLPLAENTSSWKYIGYSDIYSHITLNEILSDLSDSRAMFDLSDVKVSDRTSENGTIFTTLPQFINSKISIYKYVRLYNLLQEGTSGDKGNEPEDVSGLYSYDITKDYGNSRFARKSLNNLRPNGTEQLYDRTTDWGDNRFAHKALDNLKNASSTDVYPDSYDSSKDYGNSRFARKNLNNLRSATYDILNDKVPSTINYNNTSRQFLINDEFSISGTNNEVQLKYKTYTLNSIPTSATNFYSSYSYTRQDKVLSIPASDPDGNAGIVSGEQADKIKKSLISVNDIYSGTTWQDILDVWSSLTTEERQYCQKAYYKKIITTDELIGTVSTVSNLPASNNNIGDKYHVNADNKDYYWNGESWKNPDQQAIYVISPSGTLEDGNVILTGYKIPVSATDWDSVNYRPFPLRSVGERIEQLEKLGSYLGAVDIPGLRLNNGSLINDNTTYYRVSSVTKQAAGSGYLTNDVVCRETSVNGQIMYLKNTSGSNTLNILTQGALFTQQTTNNVAVSGGTGSGMTVNISATNTTTRLPRNLTEKPGATVNDYMTVRYDTMHQGVSTRYIITNIDSSGNFTWSFDIYLDNPERDFTQYPVTHGEIQSDAIQANNILNGTITANKLAFTIDQVTELTGNVDFNSLPGNGTYVIVSSGTVTNSPIANTNLNWSSTLLSRIDNTKWWVQEYVVRNSSNAIVAGYQIARSLTCPGVELMRCIKNGAWPSVTGTDYQNWSWGYAQYQ